nr:hypothetical protein CFP56_24616 [Quercus suber]
MEFHDRDWKRIGAREDDTILGRIASITNIDRKYLTGTTSELNKASVATKLSWIAGRVTGEVEDIAYSLIGSLGVSMTPNYGEGTEAFHSLQTTPTESRLECFRGARFDAKEWGLLAPSPDCFKASKGLEKAKISPRHARWFSWSSQGLVVSLSLMQTRNPFVMGIRKQKLHFRLNCKDGKSQVVVELARVKEDARVVWKRMGCDEELGKKTPRSITGKCWELTKAARPMKRS